jgi:sulfite reductase (NADPH) hemoprotein beta-component
VKGEEIKEALRPVIEDYAKTRREGERFGDFVIRAGYVKATSSGREFHSDVVLPEPAVAK